MGSDVIISIVFVSEDATTRLSIARDPAMQGVHLSWARGTEIRNFSLSGSQLSALRTFLAASDAQG